MITISVLPLLRDSLSLYLAYLVIKVLLKGSFDVEVNFYEEDDENGSGKEIA